VMAARNEFPLTKYLCVPFALLLPAGLVLAAGQGRVEKTFRALPNCHIRISNPPGGTIVVHGWDKPEVHAVCLTNSSKVEVDSDPTPANAEAERLEFVTHVLDQAATPEERTTNYELDVPKDSSLIISSPTGSVSVEHVSGDESIESVRGSIAVADGAGFIQVRSLNGDITLLRPAGHVEATSIMGNLTISGAESQRINAQTGSGKITFDGDFLPIGDYTLKTYAGDINVICPGSDSFALDARSVRGKLDNQFKVTRKTHIPYSAPQGASTLGDINRGDASVRINSFSGTIHMRPRS
jgi:DUF4097 and DUF4098 domain-containing protein YvlB